jgi:hypothetical protein
LAFSGWVWALFLLVLFSLPPSSFQTPPGKLSCWTLLLLGPLVSRHNLNTPGPRILLSVPLLNLVEGMDEAPALISI